MRLSRCTSPACGRPFQLNQFSKKFSVNGQPGKITCPHCGHVVMGDRNTLYLTHALSVAQEAECDEAHRSGMVGR